MNNVTKLPLSETQRKRIVEKHLLKMLDELRKAGQDAVGVAGGIVLLPPPPGATNGCHVFYVVDEKIKMGDGNPIDPQRFIEDVAGTMLRSKT